MSYPAGLTRILRAGGAASPLADGLGLAFSFVPAHRFREPLGRNASGLTVGWVGLFPVRMKWRLYLNGPRIATSATACYFWEGSAVRRSS